MEGFTGLIATLILAAGIGFLTLRGFCREAANLKNGTCCGTGSCSCGGGGDSCGSNCSGEHYHDEDLKQNPKSTAAATKKSLYKN